MESRKYQLQKQIIEAQKAKNNDLYYLLKSQWAHRFGVESLEELEHLDLSISNQDPIDGGNQNNDQSQDYYSESSKEILIKDDGNKTYSMTNDNKQFVSAVNHVNKESHDVKPYEISSKQEVVKKDKNPSKDFKGSPKVEVLIPLPPNPKYNYFEKWLLRS